MKSLFKISMVVAAVAILFTGCKKGENDPFLSLKSRTSRLCQEWKLSSADYTETQTGSSYSSSQHNTYDGTNMTTATTITIGGSSNTTTDASPYSITCTFDKEGTFVKTITDDGSVFTGSGVWSWMYNNNDLDLKDKESIILTYTSGTDYTISGVSISPDDIAVIDKLSSDELVILLDYTYTEGGEVQKISGTMTYVIK